MAGLTTIKQYNFIKPDKVASWKIKIFGAGSIGSILADQAAKTGFKDITVYDFDTVDDDNMGSQNFNITHIGLKKTEALQKLMKDYYNFDLNVVEGKIDEKTEILPELNTIYFCGFDSLEARKLLWDKLKGFPIVWGEARIGRDNQRFYFVDLRTRDEVWIKEYEKSLDFNGPRTELKCGEKGCFSNNAEIVGKIVRQLVNIAEDKPITTLYIGKWGEPECICKKPLQEL